MNKQGLRGMVIITILALTVFGCIVFGVRNSEAETNITPTLFVTDRNFLPYIRGLQQGPTATATLPPPTLTATPTFTHTPTATATATHTPTATATDPGPSPQLPAPVLYEIQNSDQDGNFTVAWSAIEKTDYYKLKENFNETSWETIYEGPALSMDRSDLAPGDYCYNVRTFGSPGRSEWAGEQCTTVGEAPEPAYVCEFETLYDGPRTRIPDVELLHDGRLFITGGLDALGEQVNNVTIFDPQTRVFRSVDIPQDHVWNAAVLVDGRVMMTSYGDDAHTMIYDPVSDEITRLDSFVGCLGIYRVLHSGVLMTYCGSTDGAFFDPYTGYTEITRYRLDINYWNYAPESFAVPKGATATLLTNGIIGDIVQLDNPEIEIVTVFDLRNEFWAYQSVTMAISSDLNVIYFSGGYTYDNYGDPLTVKEVYAVSLEGYYVERIADMWTERREHEMLGLADGNLIVLGGYKRDSEPNYQRDIELYVPARDKWFQAGSMNIGRARQQAIQLANGEIFIYGGETEPELGYSTIAPPEIGRCERRDSAGAAAE